MLTKGICSWLFLFEPCGCHVDSGRTAFEVEFIQADVRAGKETEIACEPYF